MIRKSRVLHIITGLSTGGAEQALYNVLSGGLSSQYDTAVLSLRDKGTIGPKIQNLGVPVYTLDMRISVPGPRAVLRLRKIIREFKPEIIQGWMYHGNIAASVAAWIPSAEPIVVWNIRHSLYRLEKEKPLTRLIIRASRRLSFKADTILYNSKVSRQQHETFGFDRTRGQVIPNGFNLTSLGPNPVIAQQIRQEFCIPHSAFVIGHIARFHPIKDHSSFLHAAVRVAEQIPSAHFLVVGRDVTPENPALAGIVPKKLLDRFHFPGERTDVPDIMRALNVFCQSSWSEAFPNVLGEAMASEIPCVATNVGDTADIIANTGIVTPPSDSIALAQDLITILSKHQKTLGKMGKAARNRVEARYSLEAVVKQYAKVYSNLTEKIR